MLDRILQTRDDVSLVLIRLSVGLIVFFPEGLQKLLFPDILGAGRFAAIGIPWPALLGPFVAVLSTKVPILPGHDFLIFHLPRFGRYGFWRMRIAPARAVARVCRSGAASLVV